MRKDNKIVWLLGYQGKFQNEKSYIKCLIKVKMETEEIFLGFEN
jgi:hypothetical protein